MRTVLRSLTIALMSLLMLSVFLHVLRFDVKALEISGNEVHELVNGVFDFSDDIVVEGNATLLVENATIRFMQTSSYQFEIRLQEPGNGNPRLVAKNATFQSARPFKISLYGNSSAEFDSSEFRRDLELFDSSSVNIFDQSTVYYIRAYGSTNVSAIGSDVFYVYAYDDSFMKISTCTVNRMEAHDNSQIYVSISTVKYSVTADDSSYVSLSYSSVSEIVSSKKTSKVWFLDCVLTKVNVETRDYGNVTFLNSKILTSKFSSNFAIKDFSALHIYNSTLNDASLSAYQNSTINIKESVLTALYIRVFENSLLQVLSSSIDWLLECEGESDLLGVNSSFIIASGKGSSNLSFDNCSIALLRGFEASKVALLDSIVEEALLELDSVNVTLASLDTGFFDNLEFIASGLNVTFSSTTVSDGWSLRFRGSSNVTLQNSRLMNLGAYGSSRIWMWNSTFTGANIKDASEVYVWSYLTVHVVDYFGSPVQGANVTVTLSEVPLETKLTGEDGVAVFGLFEKLINASGSYHSGEYEVTIVFGDYSSGSSIDLNGSQFSTLNLQSPWWYWYMISGLILAVVIVLGSGIFLMFRRRKKSKMQV